MARYQGPADGMERATGQQPIQDLQLRGFRKDNPICISESRRNLTLTCTGL
jgi:hypothetical protein